MSEIKRVTVYHDPFGTSMTLAPVAGLPPVPQGATHTRRTDMTPDFRYVEEATRVLLGGAKCIHFGLSWLGADGRSLEDLRGDVAELAHRLAAAEGYSGHLDLYARPVVDMSLRYVAAMTELGAAGSDLAAAELLCVSFDPASSAHFAALRLPDGRFLRVDEPAGQPRTVAVVNFPHTVGPVRTQTPICRSCEQAAVFTGNGIAYIHDPRLCDGREFVRALNERLAEVEETPACIRMNPQDAADLLRHASFKKALESFESPSGRAVTVGLDFGPLADFLGAVPLVQDPRLGYGIVKVEWQ